MQKTVLLKHEDCPPGRTRIKERSSLKRKAEEVESWGLGAGESNSSALIRYNGCIEKGEVHNERACSTVAKKITIRTFSCGDARMRRVRCGIPDDLEAGGDRGYLALLSRKRKSKCRRLKTSDCEP